MSDLDRHLTSSFNLARARLEARRAIRPLVALTLAVLVAAFATVFLLTNVSKTLLRNVETVQFAVSDATGVQAGLDEVRFKGIPAGQITGVRLTRAGAILTTQVQQTFGPIYRDATATLRPNTALEDMYLDVISRGSPSAGRARPDEPLPSTQTTTSVNVAAVLDTFGSDERLRLEEMLDDLGNGLADHGAQLRDSFVRLVPFVQMASRITNVLAQDRSDTRQLVHNMAILMSALGQRTEQLHDVVVDGNQITGTVARSAGRLEATLDELAPTLAEVPGSLGTLSAALPSVDDAARTLLPLSNRLPGAVRELQAIARAATPALTGLRPPVTKLAGTAAELTPVSEALDQTTLALLPQAHTFDYVMQLTVECRDGINDFFQWNTSMTKYGDADGGFPRGNLAAGPASLGVKTGLEFPLHGCDGGTAIGGTPPTDAELGTTG